MVVEFRGPGSNKRKFLFCVFALAVVCLAIGIGIGYGISSSTKSKNDGDDHQSKAAASRQEREKSRKGKHAEFVDLLSANAIKETLKFMTKGPHVGGTDGSKKLGEYVADKWKSFGLDQVKTFKYNILLSYPRQPGRVEMYDDKGQQLYAQTITEKVVVPSENVSGIIHPFNAFSKGGTAEGEPVYANYGRQSDFDSLVKKGIDLTGKIIIMRYGKTSRSLKVLRSQLAKAAGCVIYSDPKDYRPYGKGYPHTWFLADGAIERGTVMRNQGDVMTPEYPGKDGLYRKPKKDIEDKLPQIPSQPVNEHHAYNLLKELDGVDAPSDWAGNLNISYKLTSATKRKIKITTYNYEETRPTYTVCGTIYGDEEPDRIILLGNHRDSWTFGAGDALSGQAAMMDIARVLGDMKKKGWRPRRTIMLCSWDAEEHGIMGSTEWVEDHAEMIRTRVVAYLNVDIAVQGNHTFRLKSMPMMDDIVFSAAKQVPAPDNPSITLYDDWKSKLPHPLDRTIPKVTTLTSGSDYKPFSYIIGVPAVDLRYNYDQVKYPAYMYPSYHTLHDSFDWMVRFNDPDFRYHLTVAKVWSRVALDLADSSIIPFNLKKWIKVLKYYSDRLVKDYKTILAPQKITLDKLQEAVSDLEKAVKDFHNRIDGKTIDNVLLERAINDQLTYFERNWIHPTGLLSVTSQYKHVIFWTSPNYLKKGNKFFGFQEQVYKNVRGISNDWEAVKQQLTLIVYHIQMATESLKKVGLEY